MTAQRLTTHQIRFLPQAVAVLAAALAFALVLPAPAQASSNSGISGCLMAYNYADPSSDFLSASSHSGTFDCQYVYVQISDGGAPLDWNEGYGSTYASAVVPSAHWNNPTSFHTGAFNYGWMDYWLFLDFLY